MSDRPIKIAYCHPDEVRLATSRVRLSVDHDAEVKPHPWMRKGEVIIYSPPDFEFELPPYSVAQRHMMEEIERPECTIADMIKMQTELRLAYRLPTTY